MRGTASDDVVLTDVFVPQERVLADRPYGVIDPPLQVIASIGFSIISGAYLGVAEAAYAEALAASAPGNADDPTVQRTIGLMRATTAGRGLGARRGARPQIGDDPTPSYDGFLAVMAAKAEIARAGVEVCDLAMQVAGGRRILQGVDHRALLPRHPGRGLPPAHSRGDAPRGGKPRARRCRQD